jgi:hypothetical protein
MEDMEKPERLFTKTVSWLFDKLPILSTLELMDILLFVRCIIELRQEQENVLQEIAHARIMDEKGTCLDCKYLATCSEICLFPIPGDPLSTD